MNESLSDGMSNRLKFFYHSEREMEDAALSKLSETTAVNHCLEGIVDSREKLGENKGAEKNTRENRSEHT